MNRRILLTAMFICVLTAGLVVAQTGGKLEAPFVPMSPEVMAQGGAFTANAHGYNALFYNPAGFAMPGGSLTVASSTVWVYGNPFEFCRTMGSSGSDPLDDFVAQETTRGGFGFGFSGGIGYVGSGLGLGAVLNIDSYLYGSSASSARGDINATLAFIAGLALPVDLFGLKVTFGLDIKPLVRISAPFDITTAFAMLNAIKSGGDPLAPLMQVPARHGYGFGIDLGAIVELDRLKLGISVRDFLGTRLIYREHNFGDILNSLQSTVGFPAGGAELTGYMIPMEVSVGAAYHPDLGSLKSTIDPVFQAELGDILGVIRDGRSPLSLLHLGVEAGLFSIFTLRAGLNQGYLTLGGGVKLLFLDLNWAYFTREMGRYLGDRPNTGMTMEAAIRF